MSQIPMLRVCETELFYLPVQTRVPLKFGTETLTSVTCARARLEISDEAGRRAEGWGETPLSVQWVWPSAVAFEEREQSLMRFTEQLAQAWTQWEFFYHPLEAGSRFLDQALPGLLHAFNQEHRKGKEAMPHLAALLCASVLDQALHDAYGHWVDRPLYETYGPPFLHHDLAQLLTPAAGSRVDFRGSFPRDFLQATSAKQLKAWHLVGGLDPLTPEELTGREPQDGHPLLLSDWIQRDGIRCLKIKLRGDDPAWDYDRLQCVGSIGLAHSVDWLTADFNCTVRDPAYVNEILDRLRLEAPRLYGMLLYVEQPFPYDLERDHIDTHSLSSRKPLFLDESAHDWRMIRLGRELGWNGVALKTCKTQTGAILSACWARAHGMSLMVQDLTNPMLAMIPHFLLAANVGTLMGVETNCSQYYPQASEAEARVHPGLYQRRSGTIDGSTLRGPGFGARLNEVGRTLPASVDRWQR